MTGLQRVAWGALLVAIGIGLAIFWRVDARQRKEEVRLRASIERLRTQNEALQRSAEPPRPSPAHPSALSPKDLLAAQQGLAERRQKPDPDVLHAKLRSGLSPVTAALNQGMGTPRAAIETSLWAIREADVDQLARGIELTPAGAEEARKMLASVSGDLRDQYQDPTRLMAMLVVYAYTVAGYQIGDATPNPTDPTMWTVPVSIQLSDGRSVQPAVPIHQTDAGWMIVLDQDAVQQYASILKQRRP